MKERLCPGPVIRMYRKSTSGIRVAGQTTPVKRLLSKIELIVLVANLINLIIFLHNGYYPTLIDRILRLQLVSVATHGTSRRIGYQYMTRELLWHGFIELITFTVPLVNYQWIKQNISQWFRQSTSYKRSIVRSNMYAPGTKCTFCKDVPVLPHHIGCSHTFCYYCLQANIMPDTKFECSSCKHRADNVVPIQVTQ